MVATNSNGTTRLIIAARLGRGDTQAAIAHSLGCEPEAVWRIAEEIRRIDGAIITPKKKRTRGKPDAAQITAPSSLDTPADRIRAFIAGSSSPHTRQAYASDLAIAANILNLPAVEDLLNIDAAGVLRLRELLAGRGQAGGTIRRKLSVIFNLLDREIRLGFRSGPNPADPLIVRRPRGEPRSKLDVLTPDEVRGLLGVCDHDPRLKGIRDAALFRMAFYMGLRVGELCGLTPAKPDDWQTRREGGYFERADDRLMLRVIGKGEKRRDLQVQDEVRDAVARLLVATGRDWTSTDALFLGVQGPRSEELTTRSVRRILKTRCRESGIEKRISAHSTRKTAATVLLNQGVDLERVRRFMGHSDLSTTQRYLRIDGDGGASMAIEYKAGVVGPVG